MLFLGILEELMKKSCLKTNLIDIGAKKNKGRLDKNG